MPSTSRAIIRLDGYSLSFEQIDDLAAGRADAVLAPEARARIDAARAVVEGLAGAGAPVYGVNTGFGQLATVQVPPQRLEELQINLLRSHCAGVGAPLAREEVRATMALRVNALARGHSGIRASTVDALLALLNHGIHPVIPSQGSVGASGDLAPLAHLACALMGEGQVEKDGRVLPATLVLPEAGLGPVRLGAKEGLALINGTQVTTAVGVLALLRARRLARAADIAGALSLEALKGSVKAFDSRVQEARPHPGQVRVAANLRRLTGGSAITASHRDCRRVQDSYALRCMPQVHGAVRDALHYISTVLGTEANASTDNPLVFPESGEMISCGNFHGAPAGYALDLLAVVMADLAAMSERRLERLVNPTLSGLPAFLARDPGLHSGLMLAQVTAAALVSENKTLAHPASVDSIPTSADKEDHVSMSTWAARKAAQVVTNAIHVVAIELLAAAQALDLLAPLAPGRGTGAAHAALRARVRSLQVDRPPAPDIAAVAGLLADGVLETEVAAALGGPLD